MKTLPLAKLFSLAKNFINIIVIVSILLFIAVPALAGSSFKIGVTSYIKDGNIYFMNVAPYIKNGRTYLPVRYVASSLGVLDSNILWDEANQKVTLLKGDKVVQMTIGSNGMAINGVTIVMDAAPEVTSGRAMLPFRYIAQAFGASVAWDNSTQQVEISSDSIKPTINFLSEPNSRLNTFPVMYTWTFKNREIKWGPFHIPIENLNYYRKKPHPFFTPSTNDIFNQVYTYTSDSDGEKIISTIVDGLKNSAAEKGYDEYKTIELVVSFVQGLPYVSDKASTSQEEYPKYPVETLLDRGGDCEDTALLTAVLLRKLGYGSALLILPEKHHAAVGVLGSADAYGTYYEYDGKKYLYLETTNSGWRIGQMPKDYRGAKAYVVPLL